MTDREKAIFLLNYIAKQELTFKGAREVFSFTKSYEWLAEYAKNLKESEDANK